MRPFSTIINMLSEWIGKINSFLIIMLSLIIGYEIIARQIFYHPTIWAHEFSTMLFGTYIILGGAYILHCKGHVGMDLIYSRLSLRKKALLDVITFWFFAFFCMVLVWKGWDRAWYAFINMERSGSTWNVIVYPIRMMIPIGAILLLLQGIVKFIQDLIILFKGESYNER